MPPAESLSVLSLLTPPSTAAGGAGTPDIIRARHRGATARCALAAVAILGLGADPRAAVADADRDVYDFRPPPGAVVRGHDPLDDYSYYYVPKLNDVHRLIGEIVRQGDVATVGGSAPLRYGRYVAYGCGTTLALLGGPDALEIDWHSVTAVGIEGEATVPTVYIRGGITANEAAKAFVDHGTVRLQVADAETRVLLAGAMALLMDACLPQRAAR
jgi:hypothetical protein